MTRKTIDTNHRSQLNHPNQPSPEMMDHPLFSVYMMAIEQAMYGKGERHGGGATPFLEQPWTHYAAMHGRGFLTGQAAKKLEEAAHQRAGKLFKDEMLGAIVYAGMSILHENQVGGFEQ